MEKNSGQASVLRILIHDPDSVDRGRLKNGYYFKRVPYTFFWLYLKCKACSRGRFFGNQSGYLTFLQVGMHLENAVMNHCVVIAFSANPNRKEFK
jgi:hypothetical protein